MRVPERKKHIRAGDDVASAMGRLSAELSEIVREFESKTGVVVAGLHVFRRSQGGQLVYARNIPEFRSPNGGATMLSAMKAAPVVVPDIDIVPDSLWEQVSDDD